MAANGRRDFKSPLNPVRENICFNFVPGLRRSTFGMRASGANTTPPCARPPSKDMVHAVAITGTRHLASVQLVHMNKGALGERESAPENSKACRNRLRQASIPELPCHAMTPNAPDKAKMPDRSRERATWPCSLAFCRRRGVGFSVLFSLMTVPPDAEVAQTIPPI